MYKNCKYSIQGKFLCKKKNIEKFNPKLGKCVCWDKKYTKKHGGYWSQITESECKNYEIGNKFGEKNCQWEKN